LWYIALLASGIFVIISAGCPVVNCPYKTTAEAPIPCLPLVETYLWNFEPNKKLPNISGTFSYGIPGPLSSTLTL